MAVHHERELEMFGKNRRRGLPRNLQKNGLPFELSLDCVSETAKYERAQDAERMDQFNKDVEAWAMHVTSLLRSNVRTMVKRDIGLSESIHPNIYYDRKYRKEAKRVGFSFLREGIYIHKGAGRGQGGYLGSKWTDHYGKLKTTNPESLGKMGSGNRKPIEWFNPIVERELSALADIVAEYSADLQINATQIFIE